MRILFLTQIVPYPPDSGPKVKTYHVLRYLSEQGHKIYLASYIRQVEEIHVEALRDLCEKVYTVPIRRSRFLDGLYWLRSHITGRPFLIERDDLKGMRNIVRDVLVNHSIDCIHSDQLTMTQFGLPPVSLFGFRSATTTREDGKKLFTKPLLVFDAHNAVWTIVDRMRQTVPALLRPILEVEARRVRRYEGMIVKEFDHTFAVTDIDKKDLLVAHHYASENRSSELGTSSITVIPIAVDTENLQPATRNVGSKNILTLGTLHYPPNADGIRWFFSEVFPLIQRAIPDVTLTIAGKNPPQDFIKAADESKQVITVTGYVPDLQPLMEKAAVLVVPVRAGSGMRVRILEAFARGMPVVTTTIGLEGIDACPGEDVLVEDTPEGFCAAVVALLEDSDMQDRLARNGRRLVEKVYDWKVALRHLDKVYGAR